jgi:hypothetical protein
MKASYVGVFVAALGAALLAGRATAQQDRDGPPTGGSAGDAAHAAHAGHTGHAGHVGQAASPAGEGRLASPPAMAAEHAHLHEQLAATLAAGGKTADAAKKVEALLSKHFVEEDAYALPPLGLLEQLAQGAMPPPEQAKAAIAMADKLRENYAQMLDEHRQLTALLKALEAAANAEDKPRAAEFARALTLHAQNEEQVLYPATLLVGEYLKLRQAGGGKGAAAPADDQSPAPAHAH